MNLSTHIEYDVRIGKRKIKLVGIEHGRNIHTLVDPETGDAIKRICLANPMAEIHAEANAPAFLPRELLNTQTVHSLEKTPASLGKLANRDEMVDTAFQFHRELSEMDGQNSITQAANSLKYRRELQEVIDELFGHKPEVKQIKKAASYAVVYRSLQMAEKLIASKHQNIIAITGAIHSPLIKKFLENAKLRQRYHRLWNKQLA
ncbi:MAG: hypothetical protein Q8R15_04140 [Candidatus Micrarchaeota archaeon]|nr:hypothetical protein [Candidatus Micrarchaeota archaeon]